MGSVIFEIDSLVELVDDLRKSVPDFMVVIGVLEVERRADGAVWRL